MSMLNASLLNQLLEDFCRWASDPNFELPEGVGRSTGCVHPKMNLPGGAGVQADRDPQHGDESG